MIVVDKYGWPVEQVKGRPVHNFLRILIHGRKVVSKLSRPKNIEENSNSVSQPSGENNKHM